MSHSNIIGFGKIEGSEKVQQSIHPKARSGIYRAKNAARQERGRKNRLARNTNK